MPEKLKLLSWRDILTIALPSLLLAIGAFWLAAQFVKPAPPDTVVIGTGGEGGAYQSFAARYRDVLERYGIKLVEKPSAGSMENLARLRDPNFEIDVAFIQGGTARIAEDDTLYSLGDIYHEPLWIFYREAPLRGADKLLDLKGKRIAVGSAGSGTNHLAVTLLAANEIDERNAHLIPVGGMAVVERFEKGEIDAAFVVGPTQSSLVWSLLYTPGIRLMSLAHAEAYTRRFPYLAHLVLPRGAIDLTQEIPAHDTHLVSPMATLLVREETHPALIDLLMQAAADVHGEAGAFQKPREFPRVGHSEFPAVEGSRTLFQVRPPLPSALPALLGSHPGRPHGGDDRAAAGGLDPTVQVCARDLWLARAFTHLSTLW
jgi:TRAP transporter TAXI family solute receptor